MRTYMEHEFYILNVILDLKIIKIDKRKGKNLNEFLLTSNGI